MFHCLVRSSKILIVISETDYDRRIYISGTRPHAFFIAHCLRSQKDPPPVTVLLHTPDNIISWEASTKNIALLRNLDSEAIYQDVDWQIARVPLRMHKRIVTPEEFFGPRNWKPHYDAKSPGTIIEDEPDVPDSHIKSPIRHLILMCSPQHAIPNLLSIRHRLGPESSILFANRGLGVMEDANTELFPDEASRPHYLAGYSTHYIQTPAFGPSGGLDQQLQVLQAQKGSLYVTSRALYTPDVLKALKAEPTVELAASTEYLINKLKYSRRLGVAIKSPLSLHMMQLQQLAIDSVIKPVVSLLDATHAGALFNYAITRVNRLLIAEISLVLRSLPEIRGNPLAESKFSPEVLETQVAKSLWQRFGEVNVTLNQVRRGSRPDIDFFNGYIVKRAEDIGLRCFLNYAFQQMVAGKERMINMESLEQVPLEFEKRKGDE